MVRRFGNPPARMELAKFSFADSGCRISQCMNFSCWEAIMGWNTSSPGATSGELSWTRVKRVRRFKWRSRFETADRYVISRFTRDRQQIPCAAAVREKSEIPQKVTPSRSWSRKDSSGGNLCSMLSSKSSMWNEEIQRCCSDGSMWRVSIRTSRSRIPWSCECRNSVVNDVHATCNVKKPSTCSLSIRPGGSCFVERWVMASFSPMIHIYSFSFLRVDSAWVNRSNSCP